MTAKFRSADPPEYAAWLRLHLERGGRITHFYDYPMGRAGFLVALQPFELGGECGSAARHILVPEGIDWGIGAGIGHNTVHPFDGSVLGTWIPVYDDEAFHGLPGYSDGMAESRRRDAEFRAEMNASRRPRPYSDLTRYSAGCVADESRAVLTAPSAGANVFVEDGRVCLIPSSVPLRMTPDETLALAENLRAAALGAGR